MSVVNLPVKYTPPVAYILDQGKNPAPVYDIRQWGYFFENINNRRVALDRVGDVSVSTVFLGLDHQWGDGPPLLFETLVHIPDNLGWIDGLRFLYAPGSEHLIRYSTWAGAEEGHNRIVAYFRMGVLRRLLYRLLNVPLKGEG